MKNEFRFMSALYTFISLIFFSISLLIFKLTLSYNEIKNDFLADNWETPLVYLLTTMLGLGWWLEILFEKLTLSKGRRIAHFVFGLLIFIYLVLGLVSVFLFPAGFIRYSLIACAHILLAGYFLRFSVINPDLLSRLRNNS